MPTELHKLVNNAASTVGATYTAGSGTLTLAAGTGARFGAAFPILVSTFYSLDGVPKSILSVSGRTGDVLTITGAVDGTTDVDLAVGDVVLCGTASLYIEELQALALANEAAVEGLDSEAVKLTGDQTVAGTKTFSSPIVGSISEADALSATIADGSLWGGDGTGAPTPIAAGDGITIAGGSLAISSRERAVLGLDDVIAWDTFDAPDGSIVGRVAPSGQTWEYTRGSSGITVSGGQVHVGYETGNFAVLRLAGVTRGEVTADLRLSHPTGARTVGLVLFAVDASNYWIALVDAGSLAATNVRLLRVLAGTPTQVATAALPTGRTFHGRVSARFGRAGTSCRIGVDYHGTQAIGYDMTTDDATTFFSGDGFGVGSSPDLTGSGSWDNLFVRSY
jgi:hypothetical protein